MDEIIDTRYLRVVVNTGAGTWSVRHKSSGSKVCRAGPGFGIIGHRVNLSACKMNAEVKQVRNRLGSFMAVRMKYEHEKGLIITYTLLISRDRNDIVVQLGFANRTGSDIVLHSLKPVMARNVRLPGHPSRWRAIGDYKYHSGPYKSHTVAATTEQADYWWYTAMKDEETGSSMLLGNLTNWKGEGRFTLAYGGKKSVEMTAWCDYEMIIMPDGASIVPERFC